VLAICCFLSFPFGLVKMICSPLLKTEMIAILRRYWRYWRKSWGGGPKKPFKSPPFLVVYFGFAPQKFNGFPPMRIAKCMDYNILCIYNNLSITKINEININSRSPSTSKEKQVSANRWKIQSNIITTI